MYAFVENAPSLHVDRLGLAKYPTCARNPKSCTRIPNAERWAAGSDWEFMGVVPLDFQSQGGISEPGAATKFACKWQRKFSALFNCCDGKVYATGGVKGAVTQFEWRGSDYVILFNPLTLPWSPFATGGTLVDVVIDTLGQFVPSPYDDNYLNPEEKKKLEGMCPKPAAGTAMKTMTEPRVPKCNK